MTAPPLMDDIVLAADAISDYETYGSLTHERVRHAELLSWTLANKLRKAAGVTRERYLAALETAAACARLLDDLMRDVDVLITPSATGEAPAGLSAIGPSGSLGPVNAFQQMWTLLHTPAISVPVFTGPQGLPIGLQVIAPRNEDERALLLAHWVHRALT